ncbi:uncharacterized protein EDB91DRAFT_1082707 [Suillus paluster]|uniref:uncharacterized protein n=1 Tax=Suillus paluster TaxID=48578 RepID=UPI001B8643E1|nr:uncharacterized protein EDB91DRAFT_1082707 [Suillus paluster]KAG1738678.1 hypothetical protein EDB91DRAFT_1082707 [Suillus paluster]
MHDHATMGPLFISSAIVAPEIVDVTEPRDDGGVIRRGLMVIAKVMQNLANNIFFAKEAHMLCLNDFLGMNICPCLKGKLLVLGMRSGSIVTSTFTLKSSIPAHPI